MKRLLDLCALIAMLALAPPAVHAANDFDVCRRYDLQQLARQGTAGLPESEYCLGFGYAAGKVLSRDLPKAMTHYRNAAQKGYGPAEAALGLHYQQGLTPKDNPHSADATSSASAYPRAAARRSRGSTRRLRAETTRRRTSPGI
jgi:TPR repeat protein